MASTQTSNSKRIPLFCPVCKLVMSSNDDYIYYKMYSACSECSIKYAEGNKEKWKKGWRPTKKEIKNDIR